MTQLEIRSFRQHVCCALSLYERAYESYNREPTNTKQAIWLKRLGVLEGYRDLIRSLRLQVPELDKIEDALRVH